MNRKQLAAKVAEKHQVTEQTADDILNDALNAIREALVAGEEVSLHAFGKFKPFRSQERQGRNPANGKTITIKSKVYAKFYSSSALDDLLNAG